MNKVFRKAGKLPRWIYDRVRWDVVYRMQQQALSRRRYDYDTLFEKVARLTDVPTELAREYYDELHSKRILEELCE